jgi:hypothetical protein
MYCKDCACMMNELPTPTTWERKYSCSNCRIMCHVIVGDRMGGSRDTYYYYTEEEIENADKVITSLKYHEILSYELDDTDCNVCGKSFKAMNTVPVICPHCGYPQVNDPVKE